MKLLTGLCVRARWLNSAAGILVVLLQRTPVVRTLLTAESALSTPAACLLRSMLPVAAALGAVHSMAGASTQLVANVNQPARATAGTPFSETVIIQGLGVSFAQSWTISASTPPGINPQGATLQSGRWVINPSGGTLTLAGTPTTAGTYSFSVSGYQYANLTGPVTNATATIVVAPAPPSAPVTTRAPNSVTVLTGGSTTMSVGYSGSPAPTFQWFKDGVPISGATGATLTLNTITFDDAGSYTVTLTNSLGSATSAAGVLTVAQAPVAPTIITAPASQTATTGDTVQFTVAVSGTPTPTIQWLKDGSGIDGATSATLTIPNVQLSDAGGYAVTVANSQGTVTSATAQLTVKLAAIAPVFSAPPLSQTVATGSTVVFTAPAIGSPAPTYEWLLNGTTIPGATSATLMIPRATVANAGAYTAVAQNSLGLATSTPAALVVTSTANPGRLTNLSILTSVTATAPLFTVGTVIGPSGANGVKPLLIRAVGPTLGAAPFDIPGVLVAPLLSIFSGQTLVGGDAGWGGTTALASAFAQVGAFPFFSASSQDSAVFNPVLAPGAYTVQVTGAGGTTGTVLAELYDETAAAAFTASTPQLINVSVLKQIDGGSTLTAGFVVGGSTARTVLVRAVGPTIGAAPFNVPGAMPDPQLTLFDSTSTQIAFNDNWGGDPQISAAAANVGAFVIGNAASKDAVLLITLAPGNYTAQVSGVGGVGGMALVEIYEVP